MKTDHLQRELDRAEKLGPDESMVEMDGQVWTRSSTNTWRRSIKGFGEKVYAAYMKAIQDALDLQYPGEGYTAMGHSAEADPLDPSEGPHLLLTYIEEGKETTLHFDGCYGISGVGSIALPDGAPQLPTFFHGGEFHVGAAMHHLLLQAAVSDGAFYASFTKMLCYLCELFAEATAARAADTTAPRPQADSLCTFGTGSTLHAGREALHGKRGQKKWRLASFFHALLPWQRDIALKARKGETLMSAEVVYDDRKVRDAGTWEPTMRQMALAMNSALDMDKVSEMISRTLNQAMACIECHTLRATFLVVVQTMKALGAARPFISSV
jgi:hypothetical protein